MTVYRYIAPSSAPRGVVVARALFQEGEAEKGSSKPKKTVKHGSSLNKTKIHPEAPSGGPRNLRPKGATLAEIVALAVPTKNRWLDETLDAVSR